MAEITKLTPANTTNSLRTTVPHSIVRDLGLNRHSHLKWVTVRDGDAVSVKVEPVR
ncbi:MAG: hypothetical protein IS632_01525 [Thaumarchaeota archaeon]|nr:hypothetical protein [Nitrososphaerota archaeon]